MRLPLIIFVIPLLALWSDYYIYRRCLRGCKRGIKIAWWSLSALTIVAVILTIATQLTGETNINTVMWTLFLFFIVYMPKGLYTLLSLCDYLPRLWHKSRSRWGHYAGIALALYTVGAMLYGAFYGRQHPVYTHQTITSSRLPEAFDGYRIVQFSDLHIETLGSAARHLPQWVESINALNPDLILFTGDLVNRQGGELIPHMAILSRLSAKEGVYSILGNHDYGDYNHWESLQAKADTLQSLIAHEGELNWTMLNNRSVVLHRGNDSIALIGVENWGEPPFPQYGNLKAAYPHLNDDTYKILLSHNPKHWRAEVLPLSNIDLTLAGHTHAMQLKLGWGRGISPAALRYPEWSGLYTEEDQHLYVNEGMGCVGIPMRIGARPEITLITLKKE